MANTIADFFIGIGADIGDFEKEMGELKSAMKGVGDSMKGVGESMTTAVSVPLAAIGGVAIKGASDMQAASGKMQASLGMTEDQSKKLMGTAQELWKKGFGENIGEASEAVATVQKNIQGLNETDLNTVTENAFMLRDVFGAEIGESTKTASTMMKNFGIDATTAMDLMTVGMQKGGDFSGELLDTMNEYSPMFASMGHSAEDMMNILISGSEAGAFNLNIGA